MIGVGMEERVSRLEDLVRELSHVVEALSGGEPVALEIHSRIINGGNSGTLSDVFEVGTNAAKAQDRENALCLAPDRAKCMNSKGETGPLGLVRGRSGEFISKCDHW